MQNALNLRVNLYFVLHPAHAGLVSLRRDGEGSKKTDRRIQPGFGVR